jgi:uncharacterized membrane protein YidH (DUF202 family)
MRTIPYLSSIIVLGLTLTAFSWKMGNNTYKCLSKKVFDSNRALLGMSLMMISVAVTSLMCSIRCDCAKNIEIGTSLMLFIIGILGIAIIIVGSVIRGDEHCDNKDDATQIIVIGSIIVAVTASFAFVNVAYFK